MRQKAFSLIELMVVIAIIAILAGIALPMYAHFTRRAKASAIPKGLRDVKNALIVWYQDTGSFSTLDGTLIDSAYVIGDGTNNINVGLPNQNYAVTFVFTSTSNQFDISWTNYEGCTLCTGKFCLQCKLDGVCNVAINFTDDSFRLDHSSTGITCTAP